MNLRVQAKSGELTLTQPSGERVKIGSTQPVTVENTSTMRRMIAEGSLIDLDAVAPVAPAPKLQPKPKEV